MKTTASPLVCLHLKRIVSRLVVISLPLCLAACVTATTTSAPRHRDTPSDPGLKVIEGQQPLTDASKGAKLVDGVVVQPRPVTVALANAAPPNRDIFYDS